MATSKRVEMKLPITTIRTNILFLFSTVFLAIGLELLICVMMEIKRFLEVNSVDNAKNHKQVNMVRISALFDNEK